MNQFKIYRVFDSVRFAKRIGSRRKTVAGSSLTNADTPLLSLPLSYIRSGYYSGFNSVLASPSIGGRFWTKFAQSDFSTKRIIIYDTYIVLNAGDHKSMGFSLRCVRQKDFAKDPSPAAARSVSSREHPEPTDEDETAVTRDGGLTERRFPKGTFEQKPRTNFSSNADTPLLSLPLSYIRSGYYTFNSGNGSVRTGHGYFWGSSLRPGLHSLGLGFGQEYIHSQTNGASGWGFTLRCVARKLTLSKFL